jgi:hypothetical protein
MRGVDAMRREPLVACGRYVRTVPPATVNPMLRSMYLVTACGELIKFRSATNDNVGIAGYRSRSDGRRL